MIRLAVRRTRLGAALLLAAAAAWAGADGGQLALPVGGQAELPITVHPASGARVLLWLPSEHGFQPAERDAARALAAGGTEVWLVRLLEARFLPVVPSSLEKVPPGDVAAAIEAAGARTGKGIYLTSAGRGAVPLARGAVAWRAARPEARAVRGAVLLSPNLYVETPRPGRVASFLPAVARLDLDVYILQPALSPWRWWLDLLERRLEAGGATVTTRLLPGVRDRFYHRPDASMEETALGERLAGLIEEGLTALPGPGPEVP